jgi:hypothetical protein
MTIRKQWIDSGREPTQPPNPKYPDGIEIDLANGRDLGCKIALDYPAKRCGYYTLKCDVCGASALITTAGRPDDPRSVTLRCKGIRRNGRAP